MGWFFRFAILRLRARWRSLATLIIGVLLAALIGANASLYTTAISQVGMVQFLSTKPSNESNIFTRSNLVPVEQADFETAWTDLDALFYAEYNSAFAGNQAWAGSPISFAESQSLFPQLAGQDIPSTRFRVAYYSDFETYVDLLEGAFPRAIDDSDVQLEAVINSVAAQTLGITIGDVISLDQRGWDTSRVFNVRIVGFVAARDADAAYWFEPSPLRMAGGAGYNLETNLFTSRAALATILPEYLPQPPIQLGWRLPINPSQLSFNTLSESIAMIGSFGENLSRQFIGGTSGEGSIVYSTNLPTLLSQYSQEIVYLNIPFGLLLIQLAALVLFFLVLIAALVRRGERREIALLQSRGAQDGQILVARSFEAFLICVAASLIATFIAQIILAWFIPIFTGIAEIPLELSPQVFAFSGGAAFLAFVMLVLTLFPVLRLPLISAGGVGLRSDKQTWWQRYYLDVVLLIVGMGALYQLTNNQSAIATSATGRSQADPLLLLAPTLLFIAFSSVLLRFFPSMMSLIAAQFTRRRSLEGALASWQVSREPLHYGRITFLLALAIGIGWFAISYQATLLGNQNDQAAYFVGSDVRIVYEDPELAENQSSMEGIAALEGVSASSQVTRINMPSMGTGGGRRSRQAGDILLIEPESFYETVFWREDLGSLELPAPSFDIPTETGLAIPEGTERIGFWVLLEGRIRVSFSAPVADFSAFPFPLTNPIALSIQMGNEEESYGMNAQVDSEALDNYIGELSETHGENFIFDGVDTDGDGIADAPFDYEFPNDGWLYFEVDLTEIKTDALRFNAINLYLPPNNLLPLVRMSISDLQFIDANGISSPANYLAANWEIVHGFNAEAPTEYALNPDIPSEYGQGAMVMEWSGGDFNSNGSAFSLLLESPAGASVTVSGGSSELDETEILGLSALVSRSFMDLNEFPEGQRFSLTLDTLAPWFEATEVVDYYPSLYQERPFLVIDRSYLNYTLLREANTSIPSNELWIRLDEGIDEANFIQSLQNSEDAPLFAAIYGLEEIRGAYETDVLALGVIGLLLISFVVGLTLSIVSLLTYISLTVQARMSEFAVLRALGMTGTRLVWSIVIEQSLVLFAAIILGGAIGQFLSSQVLPQLALSAAGGRVTPPFVLQIDFMAILQYLGIIVVVMFLVLLMSAIWVRRTATVEALRLTEE